MLDTVSVVDVTGVVDHEDITRCSVDGALFFASSNDLYKDSARR
jgi:hypothetical protein